MTLQRGWAKAATEELPNSPQENKYSPRRWEMKLRKNEMKLRKEQIKVSKNFFVPPWRINNPYRDISRFLRGVPKAS